MRFAAVEFLQLFEPVEIEQREAGFFDRPEIATASFDCKDANGLSGEGIGKLDFRTGVATAEVGDAQVGPEQVGSVSE